MLGINYLNPIQTGHFFDCYERRESGGGGESSLNTESYFQMT